MPDFDVDEWLDDYQPRSETVQVCQRADLLADHTRLEAELGRVSETGDVDAAKTLTDRIRDLEARIEASQREFSFTSLGREDWYNLIAAHPPSDEERKRNQIVSDDFGLHAIAACSTEPKLTVDQVRKMRAKLRPDDYDRIWLAVQVVNEGEVVAPKSGLATVVAGLFEKSSTTSARKGSRGGGSSATANGRSRRTTTTKRAG